MSKESEMENRILTICKINNIEINPTLFKSAVVRREAYAIWGYNYDTLKDEDKSIRLDAYQMLEFTEDAKDDDFWIIRKEYYRTFGYTEDALEDECPDIRFDAYRKLGWNEKAFDDTSYPIRKEAYRTLGFTEKALRDENRVIRIQAKEYFDLKEKHTKEEAKRIVDLWKLEQL